ncbi:MAG: hypothetical protein GF411_20675 [Candidatus Lokiarchaeota archaeon]|nr:hypothetical protein [Candidatus Lokiarchaeota archaeon]
MTRHSDLIRYARDSIEASTHQNDMHPFSFYNCEVCNKSRPFELVIRYDTEESILPIQSLVGHIQGRCGVCGKTTLLLSNTEDDDTERSIRPTCACGNNQFVVGMCERIQGEKGIPGLFEKRVIVAKCSKCKNIQTIAYTE